MALDKYNIPHDPGNLKFIQAGSVVRVEYNGRKIGWINRGASTYFSPRIRAVHFFRNFAGFGVNHKLLIILYRQGIKTVKLLLRLEKHTLEVPVATFIAKSARYKNPGADPQLILPETEFTMKDLIERG